MPCRGRIGEVIKTGRMSGGGFSFEWKIPRFLSLHGEGGDYYYSPFFNAGDGEWFFRIYPHGISYFTSSDWVCLYLIRNDDGWSKTLKVTLGIRGAEGVENRRERLQEFSDDDRACSWHTFCSRSKLKQQESRLMPGNVLIIALDMKSEEPSVARDSSSRRVVEFNEAEVASQENQSWEKQGVEELQKSFRELLAGGEDSDVLLKVRGKEFPAHRNILRARSPVFRAMFTHDMLEKQSGKVTMEDCDPESFPAFLEHVYTGSTDIISIENVFSLYTAADKYDLSVLKKACTEFVKNNLSISCFCDAITLSVKHCEKELTECVTEFFISNALEIIKTVEWQIFLKENSTVANELLIKAFSKYEKNT